MMDTVKSFRGYGKMDPQEDQAFRKKTHQRIIISVISILVLAAIIVGVVVGAVTKSKKNDSADQSATSAAASIKAICGETTYPDSCLSSLQNANTTDPEQLFHLSLKVLYTSVQKLSTDVASDFNNTSDISDDVKKAIAVCQTVFDNALDQVNDSISAMEERDVGSGKLLSTGKVGDLKTWLSATVADQETCLDALEEVNATIIDDVRLLMKNSSEYASNSLAIVSKLLGILSNLKVPIHRKLLEHAGVFPEWVRGGDRRLLQEKNPKPDMTVAADGSGDVRTIGEAVAKVPKKSKNRFVIYVKAGVYNESVILDKSKWNVMMYGDGKEQSIVSFNMNSVDGVRTFFTATFAVDGRHFIAKDMGFKNTAGAAKHQAVALRSGSDQSVFYRCSFDGFQDTLYAQTNRQFYRECDITGTIDFIFGAAAVVFQACKILPRQPLPNQFVTITAQGKKDQYQSSGISIQNCVVSPLDKLAVPTFLGRPWKPYSTTVIMNSEIGAFLNPQGWTEWFPNVKPPSTIFYAEYANTGPGSSVSERVDWAGYKPALSATEASKFNVQNFIDGPAWLPNTEVVFN